MQNSLVIDQDNHAEFINTYYKTLLPKKTHFYDKGFIKADHIFVIKKKDEVQEVIEKIVDIYQNV